MRNLLSKLLSLALLTSAAMAPAQAQMAKRAVNPAAKSTRTSITTQVSTQSKAQLKGAKGIHMLPTKSAKKSPFRVAKKSVPAAKQNPARAIAHAAGDLPTMYGTVIYQDGWSNDYQAYGLYKLPKNSQNTLCEMVLEGPSGNGGNIEVDGYFYSTSYSVLWGMVFVEINVYDMSTGELATETIDGEIDDVFIGLAKDPVTGMVYGIGYNAEGSGLQLATVEYDPEVGSTATPIANIAGNWNTLMCDAQGQLYGISYDGETDSEGNFTMTSSSLCKIDKATAAVTEVGVTGELPTYLSGGCIDPASGKCYWDICGADETSWIAEVDLATGAATRLFQLQLGDEIVNMYIPAPEAADGAPAACEDVVANFDGGSLSGAIALKTPATLFDGSAASGKCTVKVLANGEEVASQEADYGVEISVPVTVAAAGKVKFTVYAQNAVGAGPKENVTMWVGADTPEATTATLEYVNGNMQVSWLPVTGTVNGGFLDTANLTYTIEDKNGEVKAEGITDTQWSEAVAEPANIESFSYTVYAVTGDLKSAGAETNVVILGNVVPPYDANFAENGLSGWTTIDANDDGKTWYLYQGYPRIKYNSSVAADDWLITPPVKVEGGKAYLVSFDAWNHGSSFIERFEVKWGTAPTAEAMTNTLVAAQDCSGLQATPQEVAEFLTVPADGTYYIGIHCISNADQFYFNINNFAISAPTSADAPAAITDLTVVPGANGAKTATVSFTAPDKTLAGAALSSITSIVVSRDGEEVHTFNAPTPGVPLSWTDSNIPADGDYTYSVVANNAAGSSLPAEVDVYVGIGLPGDVESASIARTANVGEVVVSWEPVTVDENGNPLDASNIKYAVYQLDGNNRVLLSDQVTATSYSYQAVAAGEQDFVQCAVFAVTAKGEGAGAATDMIPVGTPYNGITESFADGTLGYIWGLRSIDGGSVSICNDSSFDGIASQDSDNGYIQINGRSVDAGADFFSGLISLNGIVNPGFTFYTYNIINEKGDVDVNEIAVSVRKVGEEEWTVLKTSTVDEICGNVPDSWGRMSVSLSDFANETIQVQITGAIKFYTNIFIDNLKVGSILGHDLSAAGITAPEKVKGGENYKVSVSVSNEGAQAADSYKVELYANQQLAATKDCQNLASGEKANVEFDMSMSPIATEKIVYYAKVVYAADENEANNQTSSIEVMPKASNLPAATNLKAESSENAVVLTWDEPDLSTASGEQRTDDFEDADAFADEYGDWVFIDEDQEMVGGFQGTNIPGITPGQTQGSFWIWDQSQLGNNTFKAHSGTKYLFALFSYQDNQTSDWAITPQLDGSAQTITFWAKSYSTTYPEKIRMLYSTGGTEVSDFVELQVVNPVPGDWTMYSVDVPAGAMRFAINSCATGSFMLMVDDVTYAPAGAGVGAQLLGYDIYRDGEKINTTPVEDTTYSDSNVVKGTSYEYVVVAVYNNGLGQPSNVATVTFTSGINGLNGQSIRGGQGEILISGFEGAEYAVSTVDGKVIAKGVAQTIESVKATAGIYVVRADKKTVKVVVR